MSVGPRYRQIDSTDLDCFRYGFLSENAEFARKVEQAGLAFVGPSPEVIDGLGDKTKARTLAMKVGVPVVPGTPGPVAAYTDGASFVKEYGFPSEYLCTPNNNYDLN